MLWEQKVEYAAQSDIGFRRKNNQDSFAVRISTEPSAWQRRGHLFLVADGMGGHAVGELASKLAAETVPHIFEKSDQTDTPTALHDAVKEAHRVIHERGELNLEFNRMGTTCTVLVLSPLGAIAAHVGDSRCYRIRNHRIEQLTFDHSLQWELLRQGRMSAEDIFRYEPRNVITRSLGPEPQVRVDVEGPYRILPGDRFLLCSDGLSALMDDEEVGIIAAYLNPTAACRMLVDMANLRGGTDNITVVVARVGDVPKDVRSPQLPPPEPEDEDAATSWAWVIAVFIIGFVFTLGFVVAILGDAVKGMYVHAVAVTLSGAAILTWLRLRRNRRADSRVDCSPGTPYRKSPCRITYKFISHLAGREASLSKTAHDEGWSVDWATHEANYTAAKLAMAGGHYSESLERYSQAIHVLMTGAQLQRRQKVQSVKWGRDMPPKGDTDSGRSSGPPQADEAE